jgi:hypothetical protein
MVKTLDLTRAEYDATCADILNSDRSILVLKAKYYASYFKYFLTHSEYDKDFWKNDPNY